MKESGFSGCVYPTPILPTSTSSIIIKELNITGAPPSIIYYPLKDSAVFEHWDKRHVQADEVISGHESSFANDDSGQPEGARLRHYRND